MARKQPDTSRLSYEKIMRPGARDGTYKKIILSLEWIMDGTSYQIASQARVKAEKIWKRVSELRRDEVIFDTGLRRNSPDGNPSIVYALSSRRSEYANVPKEPKHHPEIVPSDFASLLVAGTKKQKIIQQDLFNEL